MQNFPLQKRSVEKNQVVVFSLDNMISFCLVKQISMNNSIRKSSDLLAGMTCNFKFEKHGCNVSKTESHKQHKDHFIGRSVDGNDFW